MKETEKAKAETAKARVEKDADAMDVDGVMVVKAEEWQEYVSRCRKTGVGKTPGFAGQGRCTTLLHHKGARGQIP